MNTIAVTHVAEQRDDAYRAIGRYVVQFSMLVAGMRQIMAHRIGGRGGERRTLIDLVLGSPTAEPIANAFFAMCRELTDLDGDEQAIEKRLRKEVLDACTTRNDIAHGDWLIAEWVAGDQETPSPQLVRVKASRQDEPVIQREFSVQEIDDLGTQLETLGNLVWEFGATCTGRYPELPPSSRRVRDSLMIHSDGRVTYRPDAEHMPPTYEM
jgi:hypothetical protein